MRLRLSYSFFTLFVWLCTQNVAYPQLATTVEVSPLQQDAVCPIKVTWSALDEQRWHEENDGRLDIIGLQSGIHSSVLQKSGFPATSYSFPMTEGSAIELMFTIRSLAPGESISLVERSGKRVIWSLPAGFTGRVLTPVFDANLTDLLWSTEEGATYASEFIIDQIYYHAPAQNRVLDIGFGTALPCHPNAVCKTDSLLELISRSTVRMRLVMEEGIGWCSGSFINTTRNDKTPYLLSAFHCQYDYTPIYDMWRFDFQYVSPTCDNPPAEPQAFSLTGCQLVALGQASDFLLVRLNEDIPINQQVTFAGWHRSDTDKPDTSYLVHHPNADIRKFSTCVNPVTIHPNQIGWSEGYTTPAFHHFRFKFTEGGHEKGSSGGPLFNQDGLIVGQLHGGSAGCETDNNTYVGRLSKSWNLGTVPGERLRDWLDPDNTGVMEIPSIENISNGDKMDIHGLVKDPFGRPVPDVKVKIFGSVDEEIITDVHGAFALNGVNRNGDYTITPSKNTNPTNGLTVIDLLSIQKHLLGKDTFDMAWQHIAADATNNNELSVGDIVLLLRLMLGKIQSLPSSPSWRFDPPVINLAPGQSGHVEVPFTAIKIGDLNGSANPTQ